MPEYSLCCVRHVFICVRLAEQVSNGELDMETGKEVQMSKNKESATGTSEKMDMRAGKPVSMSKNRESASRTSIKMDMRAGKPAPMSKNNRKLSSK